MSSFAMTKSVKRIHQIAERDGRYKPDAYFFVQQALAYEQLRRRHARESEGEVASSEMHMTGQELCESLRLYGQDMYGLLARVVLKTWGVTETSDFGEIVYHLIEIGEMTKSDTDQRADFDDVFDFEVAFRRGYRFEKLSDE